MTIRTSITTVLAIVPSFWIVLLAPPASAQMNAEATTEALSLEKGVHTHDGLFVRLTLGGGYHGVDGTGTGAGVTDPTSDWFGEDLSFSIGGSLTQNLVLHADAQLTGSMFGGAGDSHYGSTLLGVGLTYYVMPANIYFTGSVGYSKAVIFVENDNRITPTRSNFEDMDGIGLSATVGKEWWVGDNWGMGLSLKGVYSYTQDNNLTFHQRSVMLQLTATYN